MRHVGSSIVISASLALVSCQPVSANLPTNGPPLQPRNFYSDAQIANEVLADLRDPRCGLELRPVPVITAELDGVESRLKGLDAAHPDRAILLTWIAFDNGELSCAARKEARQLKETRNRTGDEALDLRIRELAAIHVRAQTRIVQAYQTFDEIQGMSLSLLKSSGGSFVLSTPLP